MPKHEGENLRAEDYTVEAIPTPLCRELVKQYHYAKSSSNVGTCCHGLIAVDGSVVGAAQWNPPNREAAMASYDGDWHDVLALSRLVIAPEVPRNGASFLIARSVRLIRAGGRYRCLLTYADTYEGHEGTIYKATNWECMGETKKQPVWIDPRTGGRVSAYQNGKTKTNAQMLELGYEFKGRYPRIKFRMLF